jgi:hypothetical protein
MQRRTVIGLSGAGLAAASALVQCSLDLDESLIPTEDAGIDVSIGGAGSAGAGGGGGGGSGGTGAVGGFGATAGAGPCDTDKQCEIAGGCLEGQCVSGTCEYAICPEAAACEARSCNFADNACDEQQTLGFKLSQVAIGADIGCSGSAQRCLAAAGDYVIVGTQQSGLLAWHLRNPLSPIKVQLVPPPFAIARLVSNGNRVLIVGVLASGNLSLAWIDVPSGGIPADLVAASAGVNYSGGLSAAYPANDDDFFFVHNDAGQFFPAARVDLPIAPQSTITLYPSTGIPAGQTIVASSGSRLVGYRTDTGGSQWLPTFSLETAAGTSNAQNAGEQALGTEAPTSLGAHVFTSAHDGSVLWSTNRIVHDDGSTHADAVILRWLLAGASSTFDDASQVVLESYSAYGTNALHAGPSAIIDPISAIASAAYPPDTSQSRIRGVLRSGDTLTLGSGSDVLPFSAPALGVTATRRYGVVLTPSSSTPPEAPNAALRIYAPGCG